MLLAVSEHTVNSDRESDVEFNEGIAMITLPSGTRRDS